jgi:hypothetical protein
MTLPVILTSITIEADEPNPESAAQAGRPAYQVFSRWAIAGNCLFPLKLTSYSEPI